MAHLQIARPAQFVGDAARTFGRSLSSLRKMSNSSEDRNERAEELGLPPMLKAPPLDRNHIARSKL
jgi:hypothetical protein